MNSIAKTPKLTTTGSVPHVEYFAGGNVRLFSKENVSDRKVVPLGSAVAGNKCNADVRLRAVDKMKRLKQAWSIVIHREIGTPDFSVTLTFWPISGKRRRLTKVVDAAQAMQCFLHFLNSKCFGHGHRRKGYEKVT